jgi:ABC-type transporter MlaC component
MFNYLASFAMSNTNYSWVNINNIYNCMINQMSILETDEQKKEFIQIIKINIGNTYCDLLKNYLFKKIPDSPLLKFF